MPDVRPSLRDLTLKTIARVRARGPHEVLGLATRRVREAISSSDELLILVRDCVQEPLANDGLEIRRGTIDDAEPYARMIGTDAGATYAGRITSDTVCYLVLDGARVLHATWCTRTAAWTRELRAYLAPPAGDAYVYESFTRPDARGRGIYPLALRAMASDLATDGIERVWVGVEASNGASLKAVAKAGFEPAGTILFGRRWGRVRMIVDESLRTGGSLHVRADLPAKGGPSGG